MSKEQFQKFLQAGYNVIPIWIEILADLETPVSCYLKAQADGGPLFLLESVEGGEKLGRYSTIGLNPAACFFIKNNQVNFKSFWPEVFFESVSGNPFNILENILRKFKSPPHFTSGLVGALSYDTVKYLEPINLKTESEFPEAAFLLTGDLIIFDHVTHTLRLMTNIYLSPDISSDEAYERGLKRLHKLKDILKRDFAKRSISSDALNGQETIISWESSLQKTEFETLVKEAKERIKAGDIFQIVLSQQLKMNLQKPLDSLYLYRLLRSLNPSPYLFLLDFLDFQLIGSSPEVMVKCSSDRKALLRPIAGTYRRGKTEEEDFYLSEKLRQDEKELAEHLMLIDLARNDLGRVAEPGSVELTDCMIVEKYSHVLHLVSEVICKIKPQLTSIDLMRAVFPAGTLSGAPKVKAMQIIAELEPVARSFYGGCTGYFGFDGSLNTAMTIRTLLLKDEQIRLQVGAGIVYDSDPSKEYQETLNKGAALLKVIEQALST
jgi:anthranilate synthase component I